MRVLLDSNIWRYVADQSAHEALDRCVSDAGIELVVVPALVSEARDLKDDATRKAILRLLANPARTRLMPEAFLEAQEIKDVIRRFRQEWLVRDPDLREVNALKLDWQRTDGGFWSRVYEISIHQGPTKPYVGNGSMPSRDRHQRRSANASLLASRPSRRSVFATPTACLHQRFLAGGENRLNTGACLVSTIFRPNSLSMKVLIESGLIAKSTLRQSKIHKNL